MGSFSKWASFKALGQAPFRDEFLLEMDSFSRLLLQTQEVSFFSR